MSHERDRDEHTFYCDTCLAEDAGDGDFSEVWADLKADGWRCFKDDDGDWQHKCPACMTAGR